MLNSERQDFSPTVFRPVITSNYILSLSNQ